MIFAILTVVIIGVISFTKKKDDNAAIKVEATK